MEIKSYKLTFDFFYLVRHYCSANCLTAYWINTWNSFQYSGCDILQLSCKLKWICSIYTRWDIDKEMNNHYNNILNIHSLFIYLCSLGLLRDFFLSHAYTYTGTYCKNMVIMSPKQSLGDILYLLRFLLLFFFLPPKVYRNVKHYE